MVKIYYSFIQQSEQEKFVNHVLKLQGETFAYNGQDFFAQQNYYSVSFSGDIIMVAVCDKKVSLSLEQIKDLDYKIECLNFCTPKEIAKISSLQGYYVLLTKKQSMAKFHNAKITDTTFEDDAIVKGQAVKEQSVSGLFDEYIFSFACQDTSYDKILIM